jgi:hypothetical protein
VVAGVSGHHDVEPGAQLLVPRFLRNGGLVFRIGAQVGRLTSQPVGSDPFDEFHSGGRLVCPCG